MSVLYLLAGLNHFVNPRIYIKITPPFIPYPDKVNVLVGFAEIALALALLLPSTRVWAAWGIIVLLVAVFPANIYHFMLNSHKGGTMLWATMIRLPLQILLIYWAYTFTQA